MVSRLALIEAQRTGPRVYGNGYAAATPIEGAARAGYIEASEGRGFSAEYETQLPQWQRNYEAGRQWAKALKACALKLPEWPDGARVPQDLLLALDDVRRITGSGTRPEDSKGTQRPADDPAPLHAVVPSVIRGRIVERVT